MDTIFPTIRAIAAQLPAHSWTTDELLAAAGSHFSDKLRNMLVELGVERRYSVLANFPSVLFEGAAPEHGSSGSTLAAQAARTSMEKANVRPEEIGLVIGVTTSPSRLLPSLVCDVLAQMPEMPRDVPNLSLSFLGCSAIPKAIDVSRWYLASNPDKQVLVCFMDSLTAHSHPLPGRYGHFSEIPLEERQATVNVMHNFLFGDAAVAMVLGVEGNGPKFGSVVHLTNEQAEDTELGGFFDGGSDHPVVNGRIKYVLSPQVPTRGAFYAARTVEQLLAREDSVLKSPSEASMLLLHTGSARILDNLCDRFGVSGSTIAESSYRILRDYGNTVGCSIPLMLADPVYRHEGVALLVAFGLSFSCGAFTMTVPQGGWTP